MDRPRPERHEPDPSKSGAGPRDFTEGSSPSSREGPSSREPSEPRREPSDTCPDRPAREEARTGDSGETGGAGDESGAGCPSEGRLRITRLEIPKSLHSVYEEGLFTRCSACRGSLLGTRPGRLETPPSARHEFSRDVSQDVFQDVIPASEFPPDTHPGGTPWKPSSRGDEDRNLQRAASRQPASPTDLDGVYEIQKVFRGSQVVFETALCHTCGESLAKELSEASLAAMQGYLLCRFRPSHENSHCHFCGMPRGLFRNYSLVGVCREDSLLLPEIVMCEGCSEALNERISKKTRDVQGEFLRDNFPGVPADFDLSPSLPGLF